MWVGAANLLKTLDQRPTSYLYGPYLVKGYYLPSFFFVIHVVRAWTDGQLRPRWSDC